LKRPPEKERHTLDSVGIGPRAARADLVGIADKLEEVRAPALLRRLSSFSSAGWVPACTENLILVDYVTESPNVNGDDRAALLLPEPARFAVQVEEPT
jgi:hypothetical protein